jgi:hypothetical protein
MIFPSYQQKKQKKNTGVATRRLVSRYWNTCNVEVKISTRRHIEHTTGRKKKPQKNTRAVYNGRCGSEVSKCHVHEAALEVEIGSILPIRATKTKERIPASKVLQNART